MAIEYQARRGTTDGMDLTAVSEIAEYMEREIGLEISPRQPFVGRHFNVTRAGIHADGMLKDEEIYNIFDTAAILNRPASVAVDSHSGLALSLIHIFHQRGQIPGHGRGGTLSAGDGPAAGVCARHRQRSGGRGGPCLLYTSRCV